MSKKAFETVFFIKDLSVEEEYKIINTRIPEDLELQIILDSRKYVQRTSGDVFYRPSHSLYAHSDFYLKPLEEGQAHSLLAALCFLTPFSNFLENTALKIDDRIIELPTAMKILEIIDYFKDKAKKYFPDQDWSRFNKKSQSIFFTEILKTLHSELIRRYRFTEDSWEEAPANAKSRQYHEFSPVIDLFYAKVFTRDRKLESLCVINAFNVSVKKAVSDLEASLSYVVKYPHIITVALNGATTFPDLKVVISEKNYRLQSIVASAEGKLVACVKKDGVFVILDSQNASPLKKSENLLYVLAFYVAERYDFDN